MSFTPTKLHIKTYGCQMNVYDAEKIADLFSASHEMQLTQKPQEADLILLVTCAVRGKAEEKVFSDLGRFRLLKKKNPELVIGVGGCVASLKGKNIFERAPYVDLVFGPQTLHHLPLMYDEAREKHNRPLEIAFLKNEKFLHFSQLYAESYTQSISSCGKARAQSSSFVPNSIHEQRDKAQLAPQLEMRRVYSAFVTIMEGCNRFCSYCVVPHTRGPEISRSFAEVLTECEQLAAQGIREIHFLGQNVNAYLGKAKNNTHADLADLLSAAANMAGIARLRFTTSHPAAFSDRLIEVFAKESKVVNHLHLPVQSGSNRILKAMRRNYSIEEYKEKVLKLRRIRPNISISSDFIVGFPNETEEDFQATLDLVKEIKFDHSFSFIYSPRPNTKAALLEDKIPLAEKRKRLKILQALLREQALSISQ